jgi:hypothetical protein
MQLRLVKLIPNPTNDKIKEVRAVGGEGRLVCWRQDKLCKSNCAAWRIHDNTLICIALQNDNRIAQITQEE